MRIIELRCLAVAGAFLGYLAFGCSGSTSSSKPDALPSGGGGGGQDGSTNVAGIPGSTGMAGVGGGGTGSGGSSTAGSVALPQDGAAGGDVDAARDGNPGANDSPGQNDAGAVDSSLDAAKNPDAASDVVRDAILGGDTRDGARALNDASPDGSTGCGECLFGLTCGGGGVPNQCGITIAPQHGKNCTIAGWCSEAEHPAGLNTVFARTPEDIWAAGRSGQIAHFDGSVWTTTSGVIEARRYSDQTAGLESVRNVGEFTSVWASGPNDIWLVARGNSVGWSVVDEVDVFFVLRGDGTHWNVVLTAADSQTGYRGVWGTKSDDVWVATETYGKNGSSLTSGSLAHWNGIAWTMLSPGEYDFGTVYAVWGLSANDIYLMGHRAAYRFDGTTWSSFRQYGEAIWGTSASSLWVNYNSDLYRSIGATWVKLTPPSDCYGGLWGASDTSVWFGGCHYDGVRWSQPSSNIKAVHGPTATGAIGVNTDGALVNLMPTSATFVGAEFPAMVAKDIAGTGPKDIWIVGSTDPAEIALRPQARAVHWDGSTFKAIDEYSLGTFTTVSVLPGNDVWASSSIGMWRLSGDEFVEMANSPKAVQLWSPSKDAIWAVTGSDASIWYFDGTAWKKRAHGLSASTVKLASIWGSGSNDIWVAGSGGITEHWDGTTWTAYDAGTVDLVRVWGQSSSQVFVASANKKIYAWDGSKWVLSSTLTFERSVLADYRACADNDVWGSLTTTYSLRSDGYYYEYDVSELGHFDGTNWKVYSLAELELSPGPARVFCAAPGDVWMVYGGKKIRRLQTP